MSKSILGLIVAMFLAFPMRASQPIFNISSLSDVSQGQIIDIDFHVDHFNQLLSAQYSVNWNPNVLKYRTIKNFNPMIPGLSPAVFNTTPAFVNAGRFTQTWFEPGANQVTIPDGSLFYTIEFEVVGNACQSSSVAITGDPLEIEVSEDGINNVGLVTNDGHVSIFGEGCVQDLIVNGNSIVASCGTTACVSFTVQNFNAIGAMDFSILYDPSVLQFNHFQNYAPLLGFSDGSTNLLSPGTLRVVWTNTNAENEALPDGTVLFEICFDVIGAGGQSSDVSFAPGNDPQVSFYDVNTGDPYNVTLQPARITTQCALQGFALIADTVCTTPNGVTCIDVKVNDFDGIIELQFSMNWDSTKFRFDHLEGFGLLGLDASGFGTPPNPGVKQGQLTVSWLDLSLIGVTLPDFSTIFRVCLKAVGPVGSSSPITFSDTPIEIEIATLDSVLHYGLLQGLAEIKQTCDTAPCTIGYTIDTTKPSCPRDADGAVDLSVTLTNCTGTPTYLWSYNNNTTQDLTGVPAGTYTVTITLGTTVVIANAIVSDPEPLSVDGTTTDPNPPNSSTGSIIINVMGGVPPYTYLWSYQGRTTKDLTGIPAGSYTVTVTDSKGCTFIPDAYDVGREVVAFITNVSCAGGSNGAINLSVSFGTPPYTYLWNTIPPATTKDINNLKAGTYCVTITDNASSTRDTCFTITQPPALTVTATLTNDVNENCHGAIDLNVTGGTPPYTYLWSNGATTQDIINLCPGPFCVTITDNQEACTFDTCFTILAGGIISVNLTAHQYGDFQTSCDSVCDGIITSVITGSAGTVTYLWSNSATTPNLNNLCSGIYSLTVTDASGKTATSTMTITSPDALDLNLTTTFPSDITASDGAISVVVSGGVPIYTYQWTGPVTGSTAALNNLPSGLYHLTVTDANQCKANEDVDLFNDKECYKGIPIITPNDDGKNDYLVITCIFGLNNHLSIYNRNGGLVYKTDNYTNNWEGVDSDHQTLPDGGYFWILEIPRPDRSIQILKGTVNVLRTAD